MILGVNMIDHQVILQIFKQLLTSHPNLKVKFKNDPELMYTLVARMVVLDEIRKEFAFEEDELDQLYQSLIDKDFFGKVRIDRVKRFYRNIIEAANHYIQDDEFKTQILKIVLSEIKNTKSKKTG
jgi:hypothetical protein